jgi:glycosyltransferase involved in cell wall biosynthesis
MASSPIKILHIMPQICIGGAERQLYALIRHSDSDFMQHEVLYFADSGDDQGYELFRHAGIRFSRIPRNKKHPWRFLQNFSQAIEEIDPEVVHCWLYSGNLWGRWAAILAGVKCIIVAYRSTGLIYWRLLRLNEFFFGRWVHYLANSRAVAQAVGKSIGVAPGKFEVIYNGVDLDKYTVPSQREKWLAQLNLPEHTRLVTMVGRLTDAKNYPMLLQIARLCQQNELPVHFLIVGHGEKENELKNLRRELGLEKMVTFLGLRRDIPVILKSSDIFCFTSNYEGFSNAVLEAMAAELAIVTTDFQGVNELIETGVTGQIVRRNNADEAFAMIREYVDNPGHCQAIGQMARSVVKTRFEMDAMVMNTLRFYHNLIGKMN